VYRLQNSLSRSIRRTYRSIPSIVRRTAKGQNSVHITHYGLEFNMQFGNKFRIGLLSQLQVVLIQWTPGLGSTALQNRTVLLRLRKSGPRAYHKHE
jgi:hypothetical protein